MPITKSINGCIIFNPSNLQFPILRAALFAYWVKLSSPIYTISHSRDAFSRAMMNEMIAIINPCHI